MTPRSVNPVSPAIEPWNPTGRITAVVTIVAALSIGCRHEVIARQILEARGCTDIAIDGDGRTVRYTARCRLAACEGKMTIRGTRNRYRADLDDVCETMTGTVHTFSHEEVE